MRRWMIGMLALGLALAGGMARPAAAGETDTDERVRRLEEALTRQTEAMERLRRDFDSYRSTNPDVGRLSADEIHASVDAYLAQGPASYPVVGEKGGIAGIRWGGYLTFAFRSPSNENSYFNLGRLILAGDAEVTRGIDFRFELEIEDGGITDEVPGEIALEQAEVSFHVSDAFTPLLGAILIPFGRYNLYHDDPQNDFTERPFVGVTMMPTGYCQPGIGAEGVLPFGCGHAFSYKVALTNGFFDGFDAVEGVRGARPPWDVDNNDGKQGWGRGAFQWKTGALDTLETGASATYGTFDDRNANALVGFGFDLLARKGPFELQGEYLGYRLERNATDPPGAIEGQYAAYAQLAYHFFPGFWSCRTSTFQQDTSLFTFAVRWQIQDLDDHVTGATFEDDLQAWSVGLNYRFTERTVFRIDWTTYDPVSGQNQDQWAFSFSTYF